MSAYALDDRGVITACASCQQKNRLPYADLASTVRCGKCKHDIGAPAGPIEVVTASHFDHVIRLSSLPVVVDFWAPWCGPCKMVAPELVKVAARRAGQFLVVKVNTEQLTDIGQRFDIRSIPTLAVFGAGRELGRSSGARPAADIEAFVDQTVRGAGR